MSKQKNYKMTTDERNFRSSYYEKVGCHSVEEKKSLNKLLKDRNHSKLIQFCLNYTVPQNQRFILWGLILGVLPLHNDSTEFVWEQRRAVFEDLQRAVRCMRYVDMKTDTPQKFLQMWLLENNRILHPNTKKNGGDAYFIAIVQVLLQIFEDEVKTYWIAKEFFRCCIRNIITENAKLKEMTITILKREDLALQAHLESLGVFNNKECIDRWYGTCFATIIGETSLVKVWDKICGGSTKIVIFVFLELVKTFRDSIMSCSSTSQLKALVEKVKEQDATIVNKAIKAWQNNKSHNEITVH